MESIEIVAPGVGTYVAYVMPPRADGINRAEVDFHPDGAAGTVFGRLTKRPDTPGWFAASGKLEGGVLKGEDGRAAYFPTAREALQALADRDAARRVTA